MYPIVDKIYEKPKASISWFDSKKSKEPASEGGPALEGHNTTQVFFP
jgi:hypothetical protein